MGNTSEFSFAVRLFLKAYRWRRIDPVPWAPLTKPLAQARLALVSTAGMVSPNQRPFDESYRGGDPSFREIPTDTPVGSLLLTHRSESFDRSGIEQDPNLGFPLDRLRELTASGRIGSLAPRHFSFMGSITAPGRLIAETAPEAAQRLAQDAADVALLVPV